MRDPNEATLGRARTRLDALVSEACAREGVSYELDHYWRIPATRFATEVVDAVERAARATGGRSRRIRSGAGHDAQHMATIGPAGMIFVPSRGGKRPLRRRVSRRWTTSSTAPTRCCWPPSIPRTAHERERRTEMRLWFAVPLAILLVAAVSGCGAQQTRPDFPKGAGGLSPTVEDKDAGLVAVAPNFDLKTYKVVAVAPFTATDPDIKDDGDRRFAAKMTAYLHKELQRRLRDSGLFTRVVNVTEAAIPNGAGNVLRLDGEITRLGRGSQVARYFTYGASGKTRAQIETRFVDVRTGRVVMVTADRRVAGIGWFGGDDEDHLEESFDDAARDLAKFLTRLSRGEAPQR